MVDTENQPAVANGGGSGDDAASDLEKKIIRQIEYYFGDYALPRDKFLQESMKANDGWVSMETMLKFKRLSDLSSDAAVILAALKKSKTGLMEVEGEGAESKLRRSPDQPLPDNSEESKLNLQARTAYAKGFDKEKSTLDELLEYFTEHEPAVVNIQMRFYVDKKCKDKEKARCFKGSVFMTFRDLESCKKFVEAESMLYKGEPLIRKYQKDYLEEKDKEYEERKKLRGEKGGKPNKKDAPQEGGPKEEKKEEKKEEENRLPLGAVIKIEGLGDDITREDIKEMLSTEFKVNIEKDGGDIAFITYERGGADAMVRFKAQDFAKTLAEQWSSKEKIVIKDREVKHILLEGEEERKFLDDSLKDLRNSRNKNKNNKFHKRKNHDRGGPANKRQRN